MAFNDAVAGLKQMSRTTARLRQGDRTALAALVIAGLALFSAAAFLFSITTGAANASVIDVIEAMLSGSAESTLSIRDRIVIFDIRLPRAVLGFLIGGGLAVSGAVMQGLFRNPLADPGLIGVSAGSSLGAVAMIVLGGGTLVPVAHLFGIFALPIAAFVGGLVTTILLYKIATRYGQTSIATMLLAGIALGSLALAATGILIYMADDRQLRDLTFWSMGSLAGSTWSKVTAAAPIILLSLLPLPFMARGLNALTLGEAAAFHMGIAVQRLKNIAIVSVAAAVGASVAVSGGIGFVGIVVPHVLRIAIGPDHRFLLPASALLGGSLLVIADVIARTVVSPAELPIGILTAGVGGPFFLWMLLRQRSRLSL